MGRVVEIGNAHPTQSEFGTVDPATAASGGDLDSIRKNLLDERLSLFERYRAIFALRNMSTPKSAVAIGEAMLRDGSAILRHECAYVLGQMQQESSIPYLSKALKQDGHVMVRHECAEALGAMGGKAVEALLRRVMKEDPAVEVRESCDLALQHLAYLRDPRRLNL